MCNAGCWLDEDVFLPSFLLVAGVLPFWERLRADTGARAALAGVNASVVGLLAAALYHPVWTSAVHEPIDLAIAAAAFACLMLWRWPAHSRRLCGGGMDDPRVERGFTP